MKRLNDFYLRLRRTLQPKIGGSQASPALPSPEMLLGMIRSVSDDEINCDQAFELLHQYADMVDSGQDVASLLPEVHRHIEICKNCREVLEALLRAIHARA